MKIFALILSLFFSFHAFAIRYTVLVADSESYQQINLQWDMNQKTWLQQYFPAAEGNLEIKRAFPFVKAFLIESEDENLQSVSPQLIVEKEIHHPLPRLQPAIASIWSFAFELSDLWGLQAINAPQAWALNHKGKGARVLVLDTGIDRDHPLFKGQILETKNLIKNTTTTQDVADLVGHGTHVAGTILGRQLPGGFSGVAPEAKLLVGRICDVTGCASSDMVAGIEWGIERKVDVMNLSLGDDKRSEFERRAIEKAEKAGIVVVAAVGNAGTGIVNVPAAYPGALAVGAVGSDLKKADFSQWGKELDLVAPGVGILSSIPLGATCGGVPSDYCAYSGTSMASPHVAGVAALIKASRSGLSPQAIREILKSTARPIEGPVFHYGAGLIDAEKAVTKATEIR